MHSTSSKNAGKLRAQADRDRSLSFGARLLLGHLLRFAGMRDGAAYPSRATLAGLLGRSVRRIADYLRELRERGYLRWVRTRRQPNVYAFAFDRVDASAEPLRSEVFNDWSYWFAGGKFRGVRMNIRRDLVRPATEEPPRAMSEAVALGGSGPPVLGKLSSAILATFGAGRRL
jgi:hypothetical protein